MSKILEFVWKFGLLVAEVSLSGQMPGNHCQISVGAQAPVAPALPPPLIRSNKSVAQKSQKVFRIIWII